MTKPTGQKNSPKSTVGPVPAPNQFKGDKVSLNNMMQDMSVVSQSHGAAIALLSAVLHGDKKAIPSKDECEGLVKAFETLSDGIQAKMKADYDKILNEPAEGGHPVSKK